MGIRIVEVKASGFQPLLESQRQVDPEVRHRPPQMAVDPRDGHMGTSPIHPAALLMYMCSVFTKPYRRTTKTSRTQIAGPSGESRYGNSTTNSVTRKAWGGGVNPGPFYNLREVVKDTVVYPSSPLDEAANSTDKGRQPHLQRGSAMSLSRATRDLASWSLPLRVYLPAWISSVSGWSSPAGQGEQAFPSLFPSRRSMSGPTTVSGLYLRGMSPQLTSFRLFASAGTA